MTAPLLVLTDFLPPATRAVDYATGLAAPLDLPLVLLNVRRDSVLDPEALTGEVVTQASTATHLALRRLTEGIPVPAVAEEAHGRVLPAVTEAIERLQPALVVLGRPDCDNLPDEVTTTTALDILQHAPYPMLIVPPAWRRATPPRRLLLAADGEDFTLGDFAGATRHLLNRLHAQLTVLHCAPYFKAGAQTQALEVVQQTGLLLDLPQPRALLTVVDDAAAGILAAARPAEYDAVVMLARRRSRLSSLFHRSVTARVLLHCPLPVLVLPVQ